MDSKIRKRAGSSRGFTLIEVIVSVSISLLLTGAIIVNYNRYSDVQTLRQAGLTVKNNLRFAQSKAMTGEKPTPFITPSPAPAICTSLLGFLVSFTTNTYTVSAVCDPQGAMGDSTTFFLPPQITFIPVPQPILFQVLTRGADVADNTIITLEGFTRQYQLQITSGGDISDLGLQ